MSGTIQIDQLPTTGLSVAGYVLPAMKDGLTIGLTSDQIAQLAVDAIRDSVDEDYDTLSEIKTFIDSNASAIAAFQGVPTGVVAFFPTSTAPSGFLKLNGALISRTSYAALFTLIGTDYGAGDGSTTFQLPDARGEFIRSWDDGRGIDSSRTLGSFQDEEVGPHTHGIRGSGGNGGGSFGAYVGSADTLLSGVNTGLETRPRNVALLACIKY